MSLSHRHPEAPYQKIGVKLGDEQFALASEWETAARLALVGMGVEPGLSDVFARFDHLSSEIGALGTRDGSNLVVEGYDFAPSFSIWTTIEECLIPPVIWEADRGWYVTQPFSEPEVFDFPASVRGLANGDQSSRRSRAARGRHLVGCRRTRSGSLRCRAVPGSAGRRLRITGDSPRCQNPAEFSGTMTCSSPRRLQQLAVEEVNGSIVQRKRRRSRNPRTACQSECQSNTASLGELAHEW
jgi:hypothetical protein